MERRIDREAGAAEPKASGDRSRTRTGDRTLALWPECEQLSTRRLILRKPIPQDAEVISAQVSDWDVARQGLSIAYPYSVSRAADWIDHARETWAKGSEYSFALVSRDSQDLVGVVSLRLLPGLFTRRGDVGYWLGRPHWGQGLMPEALSAVKIFARQRLGLARLEAGVFDDNRQSARVLEKLGFKSCGTAPIPVRKGNDRRTIVRYALSFRGRRRGQV